MLNLIFYVCAKIIKLENSIVLEHKDTRVELEVYAAKIEPFLL